MPSLRKLRPAPVADVLGGPRSSAFRRWTQRISFSAAALALLALAIYVSDKNDPAQAAGRSQPIFVPSLIMLAIVLAVLAWIPLGAVAPARKPGHHGHAHGPHHGHAHGHGRRRR